MHEIFDSERHPVRLGAFINIIPKHAAVEVPASFLLFSTLRMLYPGDNCSIRLLATHRIRIFELSACTAHT
jgi:hypothetical protein